MTTANTTCKSSWMSADLKSHAGSPLIINADFFVPPPPTIGELISVDTTLDELSDNPMPAVVRWIIIIVSTALVAIFVLLFFHSTFFTLIAAVGVGSFAWSSTQFHHTCSYVGTKGLISYELIESRTMPKENLLLFADAYSLYTKTTRNYYNGSYRSTDYTYTWKKNSGNEYTISGSYSSEVLPPKDRDLWHFANKAESVWSNYLLSTLDDEIAQNGYVEFPITGVLLQAVRVGKGFMEFVTKKDGVQRVMIVDMRDISLGCGNFQFKHQDSRWWSGKGKYSFEYANIPNAKVFLFYLNELAGISSLN